MTDLLYVLGTLAFFLLMWAYTRVCDRLGANLREKEGEANEH